MHSLLCHVHDWQIPDGIQPYFYHGNIILFHREKYIRLCNYQVLIDFISLDNDDLPVPGIDWPHAFHPTTFIDIMNEEIAE